MAQPSESISLGAFTGTCASTGRVLRTGDACVSILQEATHEGKPVLRRLDFAAEAWDAAGPATQGVLCSWRLRAPDPGAPKPTVVDDETLLEILGRIPEEAEGRKLAYRWLIALILLRKKALRHLRIEHEGTAEVWILARRGSEELIRVRNPRIKDEELRELSDQLAEVVRIEG